MNYDDKISQKLKMIKPSGIRKFFDLVLEEKDAVSLGVGEPDFVTPWSIRNAAIKSIQKGYTQYTSNSGMLELREKIAEYLNVRFGLSYDPKSEVVGTVGASEAIDLALRSIINDGDEVIVPEPSYVSYFPCVIMSGGIPVPAECRAEEGFKLSPEALRRKITKKTKALILSYPNNPTGAIMDAGSLEAVAEVARERDLLVISDEIYAELTYLRKHISIHRSRYEGALHSDKRLLQGVCHDGLAARVFCRAPAPRARHAQAPPVRDNVRSHERPARRPPGADGRAFRRLCRRRGDEGGIRQEKKVHCRCLQRHGPGVLPALRGVLRLPQGVLNGA